MKRNLQALLAAAVVVALSLAAAAVFLPGGSGGSLPAGCTRPPGGFLVIASNRGFNDSIGHGAPQEQWPVITVSQGQQVNIVVCNTDVEAHGFQVARYFDNSIEAVAPGQVIHVSFVASQPGDFEIYCSIFCGIHAFMQNGLLRVLS